MANKIGSVLVEVQTSLAKFEREMNAHASAANRTGKAIEGAFSKAQGLLGALGVGFSAVQILKTADQFHTLEQRIKTATARTGDSAKVFNELYTISQKTGSSLENNVQVFQSLARASRDLGANNDQMLRLTQTVQQLGVIGGSSTEQMKNGLTQFSQAMAGGIVRAEEFNSLLENVPELANRITQGLGMTQGQLRKMVNDGKLLSKDVFEALLKQAPEIAAQFERMPVSMDRAWNSLTGALTKGVADLDKTLGVTSTLAAGMSDLAKMTGEATQAFQDFLNTQSKVGSMDTTLFKQFQAGAYLMGQIPKDMGEINEMLRLNFSNAQLAKRGKQLIDIRDQHAADIMAGVGDIGNGKFKREKNLGGGGVVSGPGISDKERKELLKQINDELEEHEKILDHTYKMELFNKKSQLEWDQQLADLHQKDLERAEERNTAAAKQAAEAKQALEDLAGSQERELKYQEMRFNGQEEYIELVKLEDKIRREMPGTDEDKDKAIKRVRAAFEAQKKLNDQMKMSKTVIDDIINSTGKYSEKLEALQKAAGDGTIRLEDLMDAVDKLNNSQKDASATAKSFASTIIGGFERMITSGKNVQDVIKGIGMELVHLVAKKVLLEPLERGLANIIDRLMGKPAGGAPGGGGQPGSSPLFGPMGGSPLGLALGGIAAAVGGLFGMGGGGGYGMGKNGIITQAPYGNSPGSSPMMSPYLPGGQGMDLGGLIEAAGKGDQNAMNQVVSALGLATAAPLIQRAQGILGMTQYNITTQGAADQYNSDMDFLSSLRGGYRAPLTQVGGGMSGFALPPNPEMIAQTMASVAQAKQQYHVMELNQQKMFNGKDSGFWEITPGSNWLGNITNARNSGTLYQGISSDIAKYQPTGISQSMMNYIRQNEGSFGSWGGYTGAVSPDYYGDAGGIGDLFDFGNTTYSPSDPVFRGYNTPESAGSNYRPYGGGSAASGIWESGGAFDGGEYNGPGVRDWNGSTGNVAKATIAGSGINEYSWGAGPVRPVSQATWGGMTNGNSWMDPTDYRYPTSPPITPVRDLYGPGSYSRPPSSYAGPISFSPSVPMRDMSDFLRPYPADTWERSDLYRAGYLGTNSFEGGEQYGNFQSPYPDYIPGEGYTGPIKFFPPNDGSWSPLEAMRRNPSNYLAYGYADGGFVPAGRMVEIGERGKERAIFDRPARIISARDAINQGGGDVYVTLKIDATDIMRAEHRDGPTGGEIVLIAERAAAASIRNRGEVARAFEQTFKIKQPAGRLS